MCRIKFSFLDISESQVLETFDIKKVERIWSKQEQTKYVGRFSDWFDISLKTKLFMLNASDKFYDRKMFNCKSCRTFLRDEYIISMRMWNEKKEDIFFLY